ncbi:hypothetical protein FAF44_47250 [Nonomuraea sp. MG754425]|uniref:hypothetical protein n=1 Tax=Nonomuraea sp. MG754425 TaxID=2570319 RepID=UPI001F40B87B|nr:hypothetical protein [Nonomuraea sp. MG754425]MCF6475886.1 hypothetical protein [Nonomuraea sp. MG754425]
MTEPHLTCPLCQGIQFQRSIGRINSKWGMNSRPVILLICMRCRHVLPFWDTNSIFDLSNLSEV